MWVPFGVATFACWAVVPRNRAGKAPGVTICGGQRPCAGEGDHKGRPYDAVAAGDAVGPGVDHLPRFPRGSCRRSSLEEDLETSTDQGP